MFKNGKIFGKINIIDLAVVLLVIILIVAAYIKFGVLDNTKKTTNLTDIEYSIVIEDVKVYTAEAFKAGDTLYDSQTSTNIGIIKEVIVSEHQENVAKINGERVYSGTPNKYDVKLVVETAGVENEIGYFANKSIELKVGSTKIIETKYAKSTGTVFSINCEKGE